MGELKAYILSVIAAAIVCSIVKQVIGNKGSTSAVVHLICAIFLTLTVLRPVLDFKLDDLKEFQFQIDAAADHAVSNGQSAASNATDVIIKEQAEAYILEKAASMDIYPVVEVTLKEHIPHSVRITGAIAPYPKSRLSEWLKESLGIPLEEQRWIG